MEVGRSRAEEAAGGNRHVVLVVVVAAGKHREEAEAEAEEVDRDVVVEAGIHHGAAGAAVHTCRTVEGEGSEASCRGEEAGKDECHFPCGSHDRAFQSGGEGHRGAHRLDEGEVLAREAHEAHEVQATLHLHHRLTTQRP